MNLIGLLLLVLVLLVMREGEWGVAMANVCERGCFFFVFLSQGAMKNASAIFNWYKYKGI